MINKIKKSTIVGIIEMKIFSYFYILIVYTNAE